MFKETQEAFQRIAQYADAGYLVSFKPQRNGSILCKIQRGDTKFSGLGISMASAFKNCEKQMVRQGGVL